MHTLYVHLMLQHRLWVLPFRDIKYEYYDTDMMISLFLSSLL